MNADETSGDWTSFLATFLYVLPANRYALSMHNPHWVAATQVGVLGSGLKQLVPTSRTSG